MSVPPEGISLYGHRGYTNYKIEDMLLMAERVKLMTSSKKNINARTSPQSPLYRNLCESEWKHP